MSNFPSISITPPDSTVDGVDRGSWDDNGLVVPSGTPIKYNDRVMDGLVCIQVDVDANSVDKPVWICPEGRWQVYKVMSNRRVVGSNGGAVTADVMYAASGTAPGSGTTQLSAADAINLKSPAADITQNHALAATLNTFGPGDVLGINFGGTLTDVVAVIMIWMKRVTL